MPRLVLSEHLYSSRRPELEPLWLRSHHHVEAVERGFAAPRLAKGQVVRSTGTGVSRARWAAAHVDGRSLVVQGRPPKASSSATSRCSTTKLIRLNTVDLGIDQILGFLNESP